MADTDDPVPAWKEHYDRERRKRSFFVPAAHPDTKHGWSWLPGRNHWQWPDGAHFPVRVSYHWSEDE